MLHAIRFLSNNRVPLELHTCTTICVHVQGQGLQNMPDVSVMLYLFLQKVFGDFQNSELSITSCKFILPATEHFRTI